ncbi:TPA: fructosamine kinase family protein [Legionella pneumophila]|nr:aminoglycoside phosphotransferase family protein [Legionella pneumophila]HAT3977600.1 phosphotransferase [Legionella pneumophila]HAT8357979.1 phosphotransferase [Legionella pneumophila]HAU1208367.1 phosphotransferase [Legionella pneumophila]HAU1284959.1 phosphotransferase [Legionella pneumophila]HAU1960759.1 phosphotransferase [Legionella pneumophila]
MPTNHLDNLKKTISLVHGDVGKQWWQRLPQFLENLALTQGLSLLSPFEHLSFNYVLPVLGSKGEEWVLKVSVPHDEFSREIDALKHFNGRSSARLIAANPEEGWMLIERLLPGTRLVDILNEQQAIPIAVSVTQRLWAPVTEPQLFTPLEEWLRSLKQLNTEASLQQLVSKKLRDFVTSRAKELLSNQGEPVLLHGDLHHYNILQHQSEWLAIDPKGIIGEREFEIGAFLRNPFCVVEDLLETQELARNLDWVIDLTSFNRERVLSWCIVQAILCVCWYVEDAMLEKARQLTAYAERLYSLI